MQVFTFEMGFFVFFCCCCGFVSVSVFRMRKRKVGIYIYSLGVIHNFRSIMCSESTSPWVLKQCLEEHFPLLISDVKFWLKTSSHYSNRKAFLSLKATHSSGRKGWVLVSEGLLVTVLGVLGFSPV